MPTSHPFQLDDIVQLIIETAPLSILDIGVGFGKYGLLAREYLEIWDQSVIKQKPHFSKHLNTNQYRYTHS